MRPRHVSVTLGRREWRSQVLTLGAEVRKNSGMRDFSEEFARKVSHGVCQKGVPEKAQRKELVLLLGTLGCGWTSDF